MPFQDFELTVQQVEESMMFQIHNGTFFVGNIPGDYEVGDMWEEVRRWGLKDTVPLITKPWRNGTSEETSFFVLCIHASPNHRASPLVREHKSCFLSFSLSLSLFLFAVGLSFRLWASISPHIRHVRKIFRSTFFV